MASKIDPGQAQSLIQEFRSQNKSSADPLKTADGQHLNGFFLDRESLDSILKDPNVTGIHVNFAKHPNFVGKPDNVPTLVYSGSVPNTAPGALAPHVSTGDTFGGDTPTCPPWCVN
jgi:hypothetical protein